jgi:hypothetical protein
LKAKSKAVIAWEEPKAGSFEVHQLCISVSQKTVDEVIRVAAKFPMEAGATSCCLKRPSPNPLLDGLGDEDAAIGKRQCPL